MRFDYYAASIFQPAELCLQGLSRDLGGDFLSTRPLKNYTTGFECVAGSFKLYSGGQNPHPFFVATGEDAAKGAEVLRRIFPSHRVARADVAYDFIEAGGFDRVVALIDPIVRRAKVKVLLMGDPAPDQTSGRTMYYGSEDSDVRIRVYEKDLEQISKGNSNVPAGWVRVELQTRPRKARKSLAASMTEAELFGLSKWSLKAAEAVLKVTVPYTPDRSMRESTTERAIRHMIDQYGAAIGRFVEKHGRKEFDRRITDKLLEGTPLDPADRSNFRTH